MAKNRSIRDILSRELKADASDEEFAEAAYMLKEDNRLVIIDEGETEYKPTQIICSMGLRKVD